MHGSCVLVFFLIAYAKHQSLLVRFACASGQAGGVLQFPSQSLQEAGIHGHFFVNGGNLSLLSGTGRSMKQAVTDDFMQSWRWSAVCRQLLHLSAALAAAENRR